LIYPKPGKEPRIEKKTRIRLRKIRDFLSIRGSLWCRPATLNRKLLKIGGR
jgi:hypothetical protein